MEIGKIKACASNHFPRRITKNSNFGSIMEAMKAKLRDDN